MERVPEQIRDGAADRRELGSIPSGARGPRIGESYPRDMKLDNLTVDIIETRDIGHDYRAPSLGACAVDGE